MATAVVCAYSLIGTEALAGLLDIGIKVLALYTYKQQPNELWFTPPAALASQHAIPICMEDNFNKDEVFEKITSLKPDFLFSFYFRDLIQARFLDIPHFGSYNIHGSLLPSYRGRSPINWVLLRGEAMTGVTMHAMTPKPDAGDIFGQTILPIAWNETALTLTQRSATASRELVRVTVPKIISKTIKGTPQQSIGPSTYFGGRNPEDGILSFTSSIKDAFNLIRALSSPWPNAYLKTANGIIKIDWALPTNVVCPPGHFLKTKEGIILGFKDGALHIHTLDKNNIKSNRPSDHYQWLTELGLPIYKC